MKNVSELLKLAEAVLHNSHSPYSGFRVAAVLEDGDSALYAGVNIENASYGLTMCAERVSIFKAVSEGSGGFRQMLIHSPDGIPMPCGACRQVMAEFCPAEMQVHISHGGSFRTFTLKDLLPHPFGGNITPEQ